MAILAHGRARTRRRCKCICGVRAWYERDHLDVFWRHSRKHTELAAEHMLVRTTLAKLCKRCLLAPGSRVLSRVLRTLNNASSKSCSSVSFC